jgi:type II secretion system protein H
MAGFRNHPVACRQPGAAGPPRRAGGTGGGFTLIELILVMALIVIIASVVTPRMASFFHGRTLANEARRFTTLTRYARDRAVSEGVPMLVWVDEKNHRYGLEAQPGFLEKDEQAVDYTLASDLEIEVGNPISTYQTINNQNLSRSLPTNLRYIRIGPDGFIGEQSPEMILLKRDASDIVAIGPSRNWQNYEVFTNRNYAVR